MQSSHFYNSLCRLWYISHYSSNFGKYYIIIITMQSKHCSNPSVSCYYSIAFVILQLRAKELPFTEHNPLFEWFYNVRVSLHVKLGVEVSPQEIIIFFLFRKIHYKPTQSLLAPIFRNNFGERRIALVTITMVHWEWVIKRGWLFSSCLRFPYAGKEGRDQILFLWCNALCMRFSTCPEPSEHEMFLTAGQNLDVCMWCVCLQCNNRC